MIGWRNSEALGMLGTGKSLVLPLRGATPCACPKRLFEYHQERQAEQGDDPNEHPGTDRVLEQAIEAIRSSELSDVIRFRRPRHSTFLPKSKGA